MAEAMRKLTAAMLRSCFGSFATGVTVVTCEVDHHLHGATVSSFTSVSLDPPLVSVCLSKKAKAAEYLRDRPFTVNILSIAQRDHALHFSGREQSHLDLRFQETPHGPRIEHCLAYVNCEPWQVYDAGDHTLVLGDVVDIEMGDDEPLLFYRGKFRSIGSLVVEEEASESDANAAKDDPARTVTIDTGWIGDEGYDVHLHHAW